MVEKEDLVQKFEITGCTNLSEEILEKCVELCQWFNKDEEEFLDMWVAFGINHQDGNLEPTLKALEEMKRITPKSESEQVESFETESFEMEQEQNKIFLNTPEPDKWIDNENENEILGIYASSEVLSLMTKKPRSPDPDEPSVSGYKARLVECAPATLEPAAAVTTAATATATQPQPGSSQSSTSSKPIAGSKVLMAVGPKVQSWTNKNNKKYIFGRVGPHVPANARYMFELLKTTSEVRTRVCRVSGMRMNTIWTEQKKDDVFVTWNVRAKHQKSYRTWGRICFESETKHTNPTVLLEGCRKPPRSNSADMHLWPQVELDFSALRECCLFPGQIVAVEGLNLTEKLLKVDDIFTGSFVPLAKPPQLTDDLSIVVAAGPFTQSNDLNYQPLWELMAKVAEDEPHVLILIGPFIDHAHPRVQNNEFTCTFREYFHKLITKIKTYIVGKCTQIILIASSRDVHHHPVFPTPEYLLPKSIQGSEIYVLPDPSYLDIEGLRIGITSVDCLMHLGREEVIVKPSGTDKFSRLGNYILNQACFYPLYPSPKEVNVDSELWEKYAFLKEQPHILILPSDMRYFCKHVNETVILNPERLSKRSFARIYLKPTDGSWTQNSVSCEVIKM